MYTYFIRVDLRTSVALKLLIAISLRRKLKDRLLMECLSRLQDRAREFRVIGGIWIMLRLQAEAVAALVDVAFLPGHRAVKEIPRVELHSRLRSRDFQHPPGGRLRNPRRQHHSGPFPA